MNRPLRDSTVKGGRLLLSMLDEHKHRLLEMGAAGRLLISGELEDVLPLEHANALEKAKPISPNGDVKLDPQKIELRLEAHVQAAMKQGAARFAKSADGSPGGIWVFV